MGPLTPRRALAVLLTASVCAAPASAAPKRERADPAAEADVERLEIARDHFQRGEQLAREGKLEAALVEYELAEVAHPSASLTEAKQHLRDEGAEGQRREDDRRDEAAQRPPARRGGGERRGGARGGGAARLDRVAQVLLGLRQGCARARDLGELVLDERGLELALAGELLPALEVIARDLEPLHVGLGAIAAGGRF